MANSFWHRVLGIDEAVNGPKIGFHLLRGALNEHLRGKLVLADLRTALGCLAEEHADLDSLIAVMPTVETPIALPMQVVLTNVGATYDAVLLSQNLPFFYLETAGVSRVNLEIRTRKAAAQTGTVHYQLWNETNGTSVMDSDSALGVNNLTTGTMSDTQAAGADRSLVSSVTFGTPLAAGKKKARIRVRNTTAADDPTFLGAALMVTRFDLSAPDVLEDMGYLVEAGKAYTTVAAFKARLGVA